MSVLDGPNAIEGKGREGKISKETVPRSQIIIIKKAIGHIFYLKIKDFSGGRQHIWLLISSK